MLRLLVVLAVGLLLPMSGRAQVVPADGVSHELAMARAAHVSHVSYDLSFAIPADRRSPVAGVVRLSFTWDGEAAAPLLLDFQGRLLGQACMVNGKPADGLAVSHEHIAVPTDVLRQGENTVELAFEATDKALNRNDDYLYTLFVPDHARSAFPCFDQPDLKACFRLELQIPHGWTALANAPLLQRQPLDETETDRLVFAPSDPLPTYLFAFAAGRFHTFTTERAGKSLTILHRETDAARVAQLPDIADEMALSLQWMENYTGLPQPFRQLGYVVLPGFQFGGMEHPGCIQLKDKTIFLGQNPSPDERMDRLHLIAHETAHLWFGDLVTMRWFNDVWTKEVFANFMADKISRQQFPHLDHDLNFLRSHYIPALATDRTDGTHPIQQPLANLNQASLLYGNIIYHKAPIMMRKLEECMGGERFRRGLQTYLRRFAFGNATWDELIDIFQAEAPDAAIHDFDRLWVKGQGVPVVDVALADSLPLPNADGRGYARYRLADSTAVMRYASRIAGLPTAEGRLAAVMTLYENFLMHRVSADALMEPLLQLLQTERGDLWLLACAGYVVDLLNETAPAHRARLEQRLWQLSGSHPSVALRQRLRRSLCRMAESPAVTDSVFAVWQSQTDTLLSSRDYMQTSYHLAMVLPQQWQQVLSTQRSRMTNADQLREFDFVSRACTPDTAAQRRLFLSLLQAENRSVEPYALSMLSLLSTRSREPFNVQYIRPALARLEEIRRTNDIFFPLSWCNALLADHRSAAARRAVQQFIGQEAGDLHPALRGKLMQAAYKLLMRE